MTPDEAKARGEAIAFRNNSADRPHLATDIAAALLEAAGQWLPIETAPKDGMPIIIAVTGGLNGAAVGEARWWRDDGGDWWWAGNAPGDYHGGPISEINLGQVTHWRHLPAPPEPDAKA